MKVKLGEVRGMLESIGKCVNVGLPTKVAYWLARTVNELQPSMTTFEEQRMRLAKRFAELGEDGNVKTDDQKQLIFKNDDGTESSEDPQGKSKAKEDFMAEVAELGKEDVTITMDPIALEKFDDPNTSGETVVAWNVMAGLLPLIKEPEKEK